MMMGNGDFGSSLAHKAENSMGIDSTVSHIFSGSLDLLERGERNSMAVVSGYPVNQTQAVDSLQRIDHRYVDNVSSALFRNFDSNRFTPHMQEDFIRPPPLSTLTSSQIDSFSLNVDLRDHFLGDPMHMSSELPLEGLRTFVGPVSSHVLDEHLMASEYYDDNSKVDWSLNNSHINPYGYCIPPKELSLSLAMCQPSFNQGPPELLDQHSKCRYGGVADLIVGDGEYGNSMPENEVQHSSCITHFSSEDTGFMKGLHSEQSDDVECYKSPSCAQPVHFPHILFGSKYVHIAHQILSEVFNGFASGHRDFYTLGCSGSIDRISQTTSVSGGVSQTTNVSGGVSQITSGSGGRESFSNTEEFIGTAEGTACCSEWNPTVERLKAQTKQTDLFTLLDEVDSHYTQCLDQIQMVISSFQEATEVDPPQMNVYLALQNISSHFENLRKKIIAQIASSPKCLNSHNFSEKDDCLDPASIHKQWTLQRLRRAEQLPWRPQRGLPERSVSVLRAWLFENFLHPYPKDGQKYILARQSGLTKSQVSNWFINARVRIWKPLIEEMYMEIHKKVKAGKERSDGRGSI